MVAKQFIGVTPPSKTPIRGVPYGDQWFFLKDHFTLPTLLVIGAALQSIVCVVLPTRYAVLPVGLYGTYLIITTAIAAAHPATAPQMSDIIPGRVSAQLADPDSSSFGSTPAAQPVVVFHIGVRFNHPLGVFGPGGRETAAHFRACLAAVAEDGEEKYGMLGTSLWRAGERETQNTLMNVFYFRDVEGLNRFAHDEVHRAAWEWVARSGHKHIGIFHETFQVSRRAYETIYMHMPPLLMGSTAVKCVVEDGEEAGEERWVRSLVSADTPALKTQFGRMDQGYRDAEREAARRVVSKQ